MSFGIWSFGLGFRSRRSCEKIIKATSYRKEQFKLRDAMKIELGDLTFSLIAIANQLNIDLEEALNLVLEKYEKRIKEKGSPSSKLN